MTMRKKLVYSLMAAAVVPGAAHADALLKDAVDISKWTGTDAALNGAKTKYLSNSGETITISLGKKAKGSYKLNIADITSTQSDLTVSVGGKSTTVAAGGNKAEVAFELAAESEVTITVASVDKKYFEVGASTLTLVYDFAAAKATIQKPLTAATNAINAYKNTDKDTYVAQLATVQKEVNRFKDDLTDGNDSYAAYVAYKLYDGIDENNELLKQIDDILNKAAYAEKTYLVGQEEKNFATTKENFDKLDEVAKGYLQADYDNIVKLIADFKADAKTKYDEGDADEFDGDGNLLKAIDDAINDLNNKLSTDVKANFDAWTEIQTNIKNAKGTYLSDIVTVLKDADKQVFSYANLLEAGRAQISDKLAKLQQIYDNAEASYKAGTLVADRKATADKGKNYDDDIYKLGTELKTVYPDYATTLKDKLDGFEIAYAAELKKQTDAEEAYKDVIADHEKEHKALTDAVAAVKAAIDKANSGDCQDLKKLDLTDLSKAVEDAVTALDKVCADDQAKITAVANANKALEELDTYWTEAQEDIAKQKYGETLVSSFFEATIKDINDKIAAEKKTTEEKNKDAEVKADDAYYTTEQATNIGVVKTAIDKYKSAAAEAAANYKTVTEKLEAARKSLAEAKAKVEKLEIYTDKSKNAGEYDYKASVEAAEAQIKAVDEAIAAANEKKDYENTDAVKALKYDDKDANEVVKHITDQAEADQKAWQAAADAAALAAQKTAAKSLQTKLKDDKSKVEGYSDPELGLAAAQIKTKLGEIVIPEAAEVDDAKLDAYTSTELGELLEKLSKAREEMDVVLALCDEAKARVTANADAAAKADKAIADLNWKASDVTDAAGDAYTYGGNGEKKEIDDAISAINKAIADASKAKKDAYNAETLNTEYEATIKAQIEKIAEDIKAAKDNAANLKKNYDAYNTIFDNAVTVNSDIITAQTAAQAADGAAGKTYYSEKLLGKTYAEELTAINKDNVDQYKAKTAATAQKGLQSKLDDLSKKIAAVEQDAKDNLAKYTAQQKLEDEVTTTWNDKSVELASGNESSKLKEQQAKLDELLEKLNAQKATDKADYEAGNAKKNDETNTAALKKIQKEIVDLVTAAMEGYDEQIAADNSGMLDAIAAAKKSAQAAFDKATETVNSYKNLKSDEAKAALKGVKTAYDNVTNTLYNAPTEMNELWDEAQAEFDKTTSPTVFDKDSSYVKKFEGYEETIAKAESDFINDVKTALNTAVGSKIKDYNAAITTAETTVKGYTLTDDDAKAEVFDALKALVAEAETAMSSPKVKELDDALVALKTFDADLKTALDAAAKLDLEPALTAAEADVEKGREYLKADETALATYDSEVENTVEKARKAFDESKSLSDDYATIKGNIDEYTSDNEYKRQLDNSEAYDKALEAIAEQQKVLDDAIAAIEEAGYSCIENLKTQPNGFNDIQKQIDALKTKADNAKAGKDKYPTEPEYDAISDAVKKAIDEKVNLKTTEKAYLDQRVQDLKAEYNRFAADESKTAEEIAAQKKAIDDLEDAITKDAADDNKTAKDMLAYEAQIKEALNALVEANDGEEGQEAYRAGLNSDLKAVADKAKFADDVNENVKAEYQDEMNDLVAAIEAVQAEIEASENPAYDTDRIESEIAALDKKADALLADIETADKDAKDAIEANDKAAEKYQKNLDAATKAVADSKAKIDKYSEASAHSENFQSKYKLIEDKIAAEQAALDALAAKGQAAKYKAKYTATDLEKAILEIEDAAANRQVNAELADLQTKFAEFSSIYVDESNYTPTDLKTIKDAITDIENRINGTYNEYGTLTKNGLVQDIADDLTNVTSEKNLSTRQTEIKALLTKMEETKKVIEDNKLTPDEPIEPSVVPGDVTGTGSVDDADFDKFVEDFLNDNLPSAGDANFAAYDANGDGQVDIADVQAIFNLSMGLNVDGTDPDAAAAPALDFEGFSAGTMSVQTTQLSNGNTQVAIQLNSTADYRAFAIDMVMADGVSVVAEKADLELLRSNDLGNIHRIVGYGRIENNGTMLTVELAGNGNVGFKSVTLATNDAKAVDFKLDNTTGISTINVEKNSGNVIYDLGGKLMNGIKKGINIIRGKNGETKKVVK